MTSSIALRKPLLPIHLATLIWIACVAPVEAVQTAGDDAEGIQFFESNIRPVLIRECYSCHSVQTGQAKGGLQLDTKSGLLLGGDSGPALVPGSPEDSPLWSALLHEDYVMPPGKQLSTRIIEDFQKWIEMGAPDPRIPSLESVSSTVTAEDIERGRQFWSFVPPIKPEVPLTGQDWAANEIDAFIADKLDQSGLQPSEDAEASVVLRRLFYDLIGLPPTLEEQTAFHQRWKQDPDNAIATVVDNLLERPQFGERWGRHWLDVARYGESTGREVNATFSTAWRYRDYVIDAFNHDKPYDQFVMEQVAGDLIPVDTDTQWAEQLVATGFLAVGPKTLTEQNPRQFAADLVDEQIDATTRVFLGVSVACARCHDHKYDPISQSDYYAMAGIFRSTQTYYGTLDTRQNRRPSQLIRLPVSDDAPAEQPVAPSDLNRLRDEIEELEQEIRVVRAKARAEGGNRSENAAQLRRQRIQLEARIANLQSFLDCYDERGNPRALCMGVQPRRTPVDANFLVRGEVDQVGDPVPRGLVSVLQTSPKRLPRDTSGRLELAEWLASPENPLTARVMANRVWQHLMGQALVLTTDNFGATGEPPSHPELLDWLARTFIEDDWSVKSLIRRIATSRTYRMSSVSIESAFLVDPENRLLWRANARRLDAEAIRDTMLAVSGQLDLQRPAASEVARAGETISRDGTLRSASALMKLQIEMEKAGLGEDLTEGDIRNRLRQLARGRNRNPEAARLLREFAENQPASDPDARYRSVYLPIVRDYLPRSLEVFDFAEPSMIVGTRDTSSTPDQGLYMLNNPLVMESASQLATRLMEQESTLGQQIQSAFQLCLGRQPSRAEFVASRNFHESFEASGRNPEHTRMAALCQAIMASAEFRIVD